MNQIRARALGSQAGNDKFGKIKYRRPIDAPDSQMLDKVPNFMFTNQTFWLSETIPCTYQFFPHESDPNKSYFGLRMLMPVIEREPAREVLVMNDLASTGVAHAPIQAQFRNWSKYKGHLCVMRPASKAQLASGRRYAAC